MVKVCITDDHKMVLEGIKLLIDGHADIEVVFLCNSGSELIEYLKSGLPDVVLLDINMPGINGIETCKIIKKEYPQIRVIGLSMIAESNLVRLMIKNGADGYLHKNAGQEEIVEAIQNVIRGRKYISDEISEILFEQKEPKINNSPFPKLSRREEEILKMIIDEKTTQEIADSLFISFGTVETHRRNIMIKLGVKNTAGLVRVALEYNLII
jgi:DNA-binding NarL/FixJ family response regulator